MAETRTCPDCKVKLGPFRSGRSEDSEILECPQCGMMLNLNSGLFGKPLGTDARAALEKAFLEARLTTAKARIEELQIIVDKLPKTVDGMPITPSMQLFTPDGRMPCSSRAAVIWMGPQGICNEEIPFFNCFSTREAAKAAKEVQA